jgi:hypothetical protein
MKTNKINDERIQKNLEKNAASMYPILLILTTIVLIVKIVLKLHPLLYLFEIIAIISSISYYAISIVWKNVLFVKINDEAIINIRNIAKGNSYIFHSFIVFIGQMIFCLLINYFYPGIPEEQMGFAYLSVLIYIFICGLPLSVAGYKMRKKEPLVIWNSEESKTRVLKNFKRALIVQTIFTGIIHIAIYLFTPTTIIGTIALYGLMQFLWLFLYFEIRRNLLRDEKKANELLESIEKTVVDEVGYEK